LPTIYVMYKTAPNASPHFAPTRMMRGGENTHVSENEKNNTPAERNQIQRKSNGSNTHTHTHTEREKPDESVEFSKTEAREMRERAHPNEDDGDE
jgi:hypothetical protein